jgi:hypothetical protein
MWDTILFKFCVVKPNFVLLSQRLQRVSVRNKMRNYALFKNGKRMRGLTREMGGACSAYRGEERHVQDFGGEA